MGKPRIIIADADVNYILPLQLKFAEEFLDEIDLEIISDPSYYEKLFSTPQKASALVVSEGLYDSSIHKHNIGNVFLMMEQYEEEDTAALNVHRLYKYTSIKEIFNEITGKCAEALHITKTVQKEPQIILAYSACGGTGKTTVALGVCACLTKNYKKVLYINASRLQYFQHLFENTSTLSAADVYAKLNKRSSTIFSDIRHAIRKELFSYLPAFKGALMSLGLEYSVFERIATSAKNSNEFDFIVVDADATFDEDKARLIDIADKVIIVTDQTQTAVFATGRLVASINGINPEKYIFVCNNYNREAENALISPTLMPCFTINEYVEHYHHYDQMKSADWAKDTGIQKLSFLIM